jgi:hypothetical protein
MHLYTYENKLTHQNPPKYFKIWFLIHRKPTHHHYIVFVNINPSFVKQLLFIFIGLARRGLNGAEKYYISRVTIDSQYLPCTLKSFQMAPTEKPQRREWIT